MKLTIIQDTEMGITVARQKINDTGNMLYGIIDCLRSQRIISSETADMIKRRLQIINTASKDLEIEYYKLKEFIEKGCKK